MNSLGSNWQNLTNVADTGNTVTVLIPRSACHHAFIGCWNNKFA